MAILNGRDPEGPVTVDAEVVASEDAGQSAPQAG